jgi:hypothetical protein
MSTTLKVSAFLIPLRRGGGQNTPFVYTFEVHVPVSYDSALSRYCVAKDTAVVSK